MDTNTKEELKSLQINLLDQYISELKATKSPDDEDFDINQLPSPQYISAAISFAKDNMSLISQEKMDLLEWVISRNLAILMDVDSKNVHTLRAANMFVKNNKVFLPKGQSERTPEEIIRELNDQYQQDDQLLRC